MYAKAFCLLIALILCGCARDQIRVVPLPSELAAKNPDRRICLVENPNVAKTGFLEAYRSALELKGYTVIVVRKNPQVSVCQLATRYVAYVNGFAQLDLYWEGKPAGTGLHSSAAISDEPLRDLVNRLLP